MDEQINGARYRTNGRLNALQQLHVSRRIAPVLASMGVSLAALRAGASVSADDLAASLGPVSEVMAHMSDEVVEYIVGTCLSVVQREQDMGSGKKGWAPVARDALPLFADVDLMVMVRLVVGVLMENLSGFLQEPAAPATSAGS